MLDDAPRFRSGVPAAGAASGKGLVATSQPAAVAAAVELLDRGGTAADAAVAGAAALAVTEPCSCGPGGDCFALYYEARSGRVHALDGSGRAPAGLTLDRLRRDGMAGGVPRFHGHTITVPGAVAAWCELSARFGRAHVALALQPAIRLARDGFAVQPVTAHFWEVGARAQLVHAPGGGELTLAGRAPRAGETFVNRGLARVLAGIAACGREAFYQGEVAAAIAAAAARAGGTLSEADLAGHQSSWGESIRARYGEVDIHEHPPAGQGLVALIALRVLEHLDARAARGAARLHLIAEALRLAFADGLARIADPAAAVVPVAELLADDHTRGLAARVDRNRAGSAAAPAAPAGDTAYLSVIDGDGNACSLIQSNYMGFGTGAVPAGCGFTLHNRGAGFVLDPAHPNCAGPGKRPYHTIIPALATRPGDGALLASFGVMGGFMQPQGHVQLAMALWDDQLGPQAALDRPRLYIDPHLPGAGISLEDGTPAEVAARLAALGHPVRTVTGWDRALFGRGQVIVRDPATGALAGGSDGRADGVATAQV